MEYSGSVPVSRVSWKNSIGGGNWKT